MVRPNGMPILRPTPSWSVFDRRTVRMIPSRTCSTSMKLIAVSSERRRPPANPISEQSPISQVLEPIAYRPENGEEVLTEELGLMFRPWARRMPRIVARTNGLVAGLRRPLAPCAIEIAARRRVRVETFRIAA